MPRTVNPALVRFDEEGQPLNMEAAILDAQDWLCWLYNNGMSPRLTAKEVSEQMPRLKRCIESLQKFLPTLPEGAETDDNYL